MLTAAEAMVVHFEQSINVLNTAQDDYLFVAALLKIADRIAAAFAHGRKLLIAGNGGSAADAQHIAAEFVGRFRLERVPLPAIALTADSAILTAVGNDYSYAQVFSRQVAALGQPGDVFLGMSTSGQSVNILAALERARQLNMTTIGFTGMITGSMAEKCDLLLSVPARDTALVQQVYMVAAHAMCGYVEQVLQLGAE